MTNELCSEKHKQLHETLENYKERLDNHSRRLDIVERDSKGFEVQITNLCKQLEDLTKTIKWFMRLITGSFITGAIGIIFLLAQRGLKL